MAGRTWPHESGASSIPITGRRFGSCRRCDLILHLCQQLFLFVQLLFIFALFAGSGIDLLLIAVDLGCLGIHGLVDRLLLCLHFTQQIFLLLLFFLQSFLLFFYVLHGITQLLHHPLIILIHLSCIFYPIYHICHTVRFQKCSQHRRIPVFIQIADPRFHHLILILRIRFCFFQLFCTSCYIIFRSCYIIFQLFDLGRKSIHLPVKLIDI